MVDSEPAVRERDQDTPPLRLPPWKWIWKLLMVIIAAGFLAAAAFGFLYAIRGLISLLLVALFGSFALEPAVGWLSSKGMRRGLATFVILFGTMLAGALLLAIMIPVFVNQVIALVRAAPDLLEKASSFTQRWFHVTLSVKSIRDALANANVDLQSFASNIAGNVLGVGAALAGALFRMLTLALFTFYLVADGPKVRRQVCSVLPPAQQRTVLWTWEVAIDKTGAYLYSRLVLAVLSGTATFIVLRILGVQSAVALAVWMGLVSQFIPAVGTYIAMALPLLVAVTGDPLDALFLLIFFTAYQQLENLVLAPKISSRTLQLHPALAFGSVIAGASINGVVGALLALPAAAVIQAVLSSYLHRHEVMETNLTRQVG